MTHVWRSVVVAAGLVFTLRGTVSWGAPPPPPNNDVSDDNFNTAGGSGALSVTTGFNNTAFGDNALKSDTTGSQNTASGGTQVFINSNGQLGTVNSSARYKRDIQTMGSRSEGLYHLRPVTFRYKQDPQGQRQYGLIAEEVVKVYPDLVVRGTDGQVETVQYHALVPMLLNEVQHQQQALKAQAQQVDELKDQNARLQEALARQQERDEEQRAQNAALAARLEQLEAGATRAATLVSR